MNGEHTSAREDQLDRERAEGQLQHERHLDEHRELIARHTPAHEAALKRKRSRPYHTDEGHEVPAFVLYRYECSCGWRGLGWYAEPGRARWHYERHLSP